MIQEIKIDNHILKYQISFKNNKNTYFHFKKKGYIQINASKHQSHKGIIKFIKNNSESFINKYKKTQISFIDDGNYYFFGEKYNKIIDKDTSKIVMDHINHTIKEPDIPVDQLQLMYKTMEKAVILGKLEILKEKYIDNGLIDIKDITFKTRYMQTRFGSCNPIKKAININLYLVNYNESHLEYVFLHEISHLVHRNHSIDYYQLLCKLSKNHKQLKKELNNKFKNR